MVASLPVVTLQVVSGPPPLGAGGGVYERGDRQPRHHHRQRRRPRSPRTWASTTELQWVPDAYLVVYAGLLLLAGAIGDRIGHKRLLAAGLVFFGAGSVMSSLSGSVGVLIACRVVMGVGAAAIMPASLALLTSVFTGERRALALGFWSAAAGGGAAAGPLIGGVLLVEWSWRAVFLVNVPLVAVALAADAWGAARHRPRAPDL